MKILDRYIMLSVAGAFFFGIAMFMGLLMAMDLMKRLVDLIAYQHVPASIALQIFGLRIPGMLTYAFPMSVLLAILLVFNRMSSESEMVAIRAAGISFVRMIVPTMIFACLVVAATYLIADRFAPYAGRLSTDLMNRALRQKQQAETINYTHRDEKTGDTLYTINAADIDVEKNQMRRVVLESYVDGVPSVRVYAEHAEWLPEEGRWVFHPPFHVSSVSPDPRKSGGFRLESIDDAAELDVSHVTARLKESPFDLSSASKRPEDYTSEQLRVYVAHLREIGLEGTKSAGQWRMGLAQRFATPFSCLVFALIAAPLGLRHHRTSSAVGLGISLLVIFGFYFLTVYMNMFGQSGTMDPTLAAWIPNGVGAIIGLGLIVNANR